MLSDRDHKPQTTTQAASDTDRELGGAWASHAQTTAVRAGTAHARLETAHLREGTGVSVENQFTVFGAAGAVLFMVLSGLLLARFGPAREEG